jgi:hypothetical protein
MVEVFASRFSHTTGQADILNKSLHTGPFHTLQVKLGMIDIYSSLRVGVKANCEKD